MVQYIQFKEFLPSLQKMNQMGGEAKKRADKIWNIWGKMSALEEDPFLGFSLTNYGESRIKHARKYDLGGGYRLITIHDSNYCLLCFAGNHDQCDRWLDKNKGLTLVRNTKGEYDGVKATRDISVVDLRTTSESDYADRKLVDRIDKNKLDKLIPLIPPQSMFDFFNLNTASTDNYIENLLSSVSDTAVSNFVYDVLVSLRAGDINSVNARFELYFNESVPLETLNENELLEINDGMTVKKIVINSPEYNKWFRKFIDSVGYQDWMLFMHPEQQKIVDANFEGVTKLSGVSGSGKTCVIVNRAIRLAKENNEKPILIITLNKSLSALISGLLDYACPDVLIRKRIQSVSFFELCQRMLFEFEPENKRLYNDVTWKGEEHIDEIWREYYRCETNNNDANVLFDIHKSLNNQGVNPEDYLRQEMDWIRSACSPESRDAYKEIERKGRAIAFQPRQRLLMLEGLQGWERKMNDIGVIDYLGLPTKLFGHIGKIQSSYSSVLVDEVQDFGTIELMLIRRLVPEGKNDLFVCGDMAQHVLPKHQSFKMAEMYIPGARSLEIKRNYRNSREILRAAYSVFMKNMDQDIIFDSDIEILDPQYANFSTPKPLVVRAESLFEEISFSLTYLDELNKNDMNHKGCVVIAGFTMLEIKKFADQIGIPVLDGSLGFSSNSLYVSDLEQTKGYEFDTVCILNCSHGVLPPLDMPKEEHFREVCRLYVAMTRAKRQLILSYSGVITEWLREDISTDIFEYDSWSNVHIIDRSKEYCNPVKLPNNIENPIESTLQYHGRKFLYTRHAIGMSIDLQEKIDSLIDGIGMISDGKSVKWENIKNAIEAVKLEPNAKRLFGQKVWNEFIDKTAEIS